MDSFLEEVNQQIDGVPLQRCFHCRKCTAGCPLASAMDLKPNELIKRIQRGQRREVLGSAAIWLCASCETCTTRCPNQVDIARMMDALRQMALAAGGAAREKNIQAFHSAFLGSIRKSGRINETAMMVSYKLQSKDYFSDMVMGLGMFAKGKLSPFAPKTKNLAAVRRIFEQTKPAGR
ncbi:MAG: 4Fe-4S dicluster domain-containing protein [Deltaproteobacteria bacterium]|nr:4Fe-4S dicluster domain-containing protein [Deltaproteobacteria bacterium]